jgi:hypothetical protein
MIDDVGSPIASEDATVTAFVFDVDVAMLENQTLPGLRSYGLEERGIAVRPFTNRNELLRAIASERRPSVALVDLQLDERFDHNWSGHRIIETIRFHPLLRVNCRPLALTIYARPAIHRLVEAHGGYAIVCRGEIDGSADFDLAGMLRAQARRPAWGPGHDVGCDVIPSTDAIDEMHSAETEAKELREVQRIFRRRQTLNERQWMALRYFAVPLDGVSIGSLLSLEFHVNGATVIEGLQSALLPAYRTHGPDLRRAALDLFEALPDRRPVPTLELSFNELPRLSWIRDMSGADLRELKKLGFLDTRAEEVLEEVVFETTPNEWPSGAAGQSTWLKFVRRRMATLAAPTAGGDPAMARGAAERRHQADLIRAVHNLLDTDAARRAG